jgi:integrase/recombinase XerC
MSTYVVQKVDVDKTVALYYNIQTQRTYRYALQKFVGRECSAVGIQTEVSTWGDLASSMVTVRKAALKNLVRYLSNMGRCEPSVMDHVSFPTGRPKFEREALSEGTVLKLIDAASGPYEKLLLSILYDTGLRIGTIADIKYSHLGRDSFRIQVKHGKWLTVYVTPGMKKAFTRLSGIPSEYVFDTLGEHDARAKRVSRVFGDVCKRAGVKATPHQMRHTFATRLAGKGVPVPVIATIMGHNDIKTTQGYIHLEEQAYTAVMKSAMGVDNYG